MPYPDTEIGRLKALEARRRYRAREHVKRFGPDAGDMRGKHGHQARGMQSGKWNREKIVSSYGYTKIRVGQDHPLADPNGYAYEHLLVWISSGRRAPDVTELLHHKNGNRRNNRLDNLELMTRSAHCSYHASQRHRNNPRSIPPKDPAERPESLR